MTAARITPRARPRARAATGTADAGSAGDGQRGLLARPRGRLVYCAGRHGMRALLQRVIEASVEADAQVVGRIDRGVVTLLGVASSDGPQDSQYLSEKILHLRIFDDEQGKLNHSLLATGGACLLVSQFTLLADTRRGRRPDFLAAARPEVAEPLVRDVAGRLRSAGVPVVEGCFGAKMVVRLANDGPVTIWLDSRERA
jgi:D-tyrosyl-tRNA(Tyr) deacylase